MEKSKQDKTNKLQELIDLFHTNIKQYKSNRYDEANTRVDFIDKFFELLDWDVRNTQCFSEQYREVVREDKVIVEGKQKANLLDKQIDSLIYELYGLTDEEIKIAEESV